MHLVQGVLPRVPIRHWVCTFPWGVRAVLGYDRELCREAASAFATELSRSLKRRAKELLGLARMDDALTGSVCVVQRTDGALRLNVHLHVLALDGVYTEDAASELNFQALPTPTSAEVSQIAGHAGGASFFGPEQHNVPPEPLATTHRRRADALSTREVDFWGT